MPIYVYQCNRCDNRTEVFQRRQTGAQPACEYCQSADLERVFTPFAIYRSELQKLEQLDPKYYKKVDEQIAATPMAEPMRHLKKMTPFAAAPEAGDPITF